MGLALALLFATPGARAQDACDAPRPVCDARAAVYAISAFDPVGSAVRIGPDLLVTNRHLVADETTVEVHLPDGGKASGDVIPSSYEGDAILIRANLPDGPVLKAGDDVSGELWSIGQDTASKKVKVYPKGKVLLRPAEGKPYARLYHTAYSHYGNSGGALVNARGELVGIIASGGEGRNEAVPASQINVLEANSGPDQADRSRQIGKDIRECTLMVEKGYRIRGAPPDKFAGVLETSCKANTNRLLYDLAGEFFGKNNRLETSREFYERSIEKDPNAINARLGLVVVLRAARKLDDARPHVKWLLDVIPSDRILLPIALATGKVTGDQALAERALKLIAEHAPNQLDAAKNFLKSPINR